MAGLKCVAPVPCTQCPLLSVVSLIKTEVAPTCKAQSSLHLISKHFHTCLCPRLNRTCTQNSISLTKAGLDSAAALYSLILSLALSVLPYLTLFMVKLIPFPHCCLLLLLLLFFHLLHYSLPCSPSWFPFSCSFCPINSFSFSAFPFSIFITLFKLSFIFPVFSL